MSTDYRRVNRYLNDAMDSLEEALEELNVLGDTYDQILSAQKELEIALRYLDEDMEGAGDVYGVGSKI